MVDTKAADVNQEVKSINITTASSTNETNPIIEPIDIIKLNLTDDLECNSEDLRKIILDVSKV